MKIADSGMPEPRYWESLLDTGLILEKMKIPKNSIVAEFGCGYGTFTLALAPEVRQIIAFDIDPVMVRRTAFRARLQGHANIQCSASDLIADGTGLPNSHCDVVLLFNILHGDTCLPLLLEAARILRPGGLAAIIHWRFDTSTPRGPCMEMRKTPDELHAMARASGFCASGEILTLPPHHYGLRAIRT